MTRERLPDRRPHITCTVTHLDIFATGKPMEIEITYGFVLDGNRSVLKEMFVAAKSHPLMPLINDVCILISRLLQHGDTIESIAEGLGENRKEGEIKGAASSWIGTVTRQGLALQNDINAEML